MLQLPIKGSTNKIIIKPGKIIAVGCNYREHVMESKVFDHRDLKIPDEPILFAKTPNVLIGMGEPIIIPAIIKSYNFSSPRTDHEAELAVIIGKKCKNIDEEDALKYVYGYTCFNDVSQRDIQKTDASGWFRGKSFDTFGPIGPVVVPVEAIGNPQKLVISCKVNGKIMQYASTADMIFSISYLISFISHNLTLEEGDIIATGTPAGVSALHPGDIVEVEIENIGILSNPVQEES